MTTHPGAVAVNDKGWAGSDGDLIAAPRSGQVAAGLDVHGKVFFKCDRGDSRGDGMLALDNIDSVLAGRPAPTVLALQGA